MTDDPNAVVKVASGTLVQIELYQQALKAAGIESKVAGTDLSGGFGTVVPNAVELYVHAGDAAAAGAEIRDLEADRGHTDVPDADGPGE